MWILYFPTSTIWMFWWLYNKRVTGVDGDCHSEKGAKNIKSLWLNKMTCNFFDRLWLWSLVDLLCLFETLTMFGGVLAGNSHKIHLWCFKLTPKILPSGLLDPSRNFRKRYGGQSHGNGNNIIAGINEHTAYSKIIPKSCWHHSCYAVQKKAAHL